MYNIRKDKEMCIQRRYLFILFTKGWIQGPHKLPRKFKRAISHPS
jgi:sulfite reductase beta subunit-like hemoprotein